MQLPKPGKRKKGKKRSNATLAERKANDTSLYWANKAKTAWGKYIHTKYTSCLVCGRTSGKLDAHHLLTKGANSLFKHDPNNGVLLCVHHHKWDKELSAHGTPALFKSWVATYHPEKAKWMEEHRYKTGKANHRESYERLKELLEAGGTLD